VELAIGGTNIEAKVYKTITEGKGYRNLGRPQRSGESLKKGNVIEL
jgi:hypothetical protein